MIVFWAGIFYFYGRGVLAGQVSSKCLHIPGKSIVKYSTGQFSLSLSLDFARSTVQICFRFKLVLLIRAA